MKKTFPWLVAGATHIGLWLLFWWDAPKRFWGDEYVYLRCAKALLAGDPSWWPEPLWPPLYAHFVAGTLWLSNGGLWFVQLAQTLLLVVSAFVFAELASKWTGSERAAVWTGFGLLCYVPLAAFAQYIWPEILHLTLFSILLWCLSERGRDIVWCAVAGCVLGLALLTKSLLGPFAPVLVLGAFWGDRGPRRGLRIATVVVMAAVTVAPVVTAQHRRLGRAMIADSGGFNIWVGLNDRGMKSFEHEYVRQAYEEYLESGASFVEKNREYRNRSVALLRERGVWPILQGQLRRQYFRFFDKDSYLTEQLPGGAASRQQVGYREVSPWSAVVWRGLSYMQYGVLLALAPFGFLVGLGRGQRWPRILLLFVFYNMALFLLLHVTSRYRIQLVPVAMLGVASSVVWWQERADRVDPARWRIVASAVVSLTLLVLAFSRGFDPTL